jgi:hypothetical protein
MLYFGAGLHIEVVTHFSQIKEFVFIDVQPRSEFDPLPGYKEKFYDNLIQTCSIYGFTLFATIVLNKLKTVTKLCPHINPTLLEFSNASTGQTLKYYISTNIEYDMCPILQRDIASADAMIFSGYFPSKKVLEFIDIHALTFYCYTWTGYFNSDSVKDKILDTLHQTSDPLKYVVVDIDTGEQMHRCTSIEEVDQFITQLRAKGMLNM